MADQTEKEALRTLEKLGYKVKLSKPTVKKTFEVEVELLERFSEVQRKSGIKIKDAIGEALEDWCRKKR